MFVDSFFSFFPSGNPLSPDPPIPSLDFQCQVPFWAPGCSQHTGRPGGSRRCSACMTSSPTATSPSRSPPPLWRRTRAGWPWRGTWTAWRSRWSTSTSPVCVAFSRCLCAPFAWPFWECQKSSVSQKQRFAFHFKMLHVVYVIPPPIQSQPRDDDTHQIVPYVLLY